MPESNAERDRELTEDADAHAQHEAFLLKKQDGTLSDDDVDPEPDAS